MNILWSNQPFLFSFVPKTKHINLNCRKSISGKLNCTVLQRCTTVW